MSTSTETQNKTTDENKKQPFSAADAPVFAPSPVLLLNNAMTSQPGQTLLHSVSHAQINGRNNSATHPIIDQKDGEQPAAPNLQYLETLLQFQNLQLLASQSATNLPQTQTLQSSTINPYCVDYTAQNQLPPNQMNQSQTNQYQIPQTYSGQNFQPGQPFQPPQQNHYHQTQNFQNSMQINSLNQALSQNLLYQNQQQPVPTQPLTALHPPVQQTHQNPYNNPYLYQNTPATQITHTTLPEIENQTFIIDTDGSRDATIALLMALKHTKINVRAVTCVAGRHGLKHATANVIRTIQAAGKPTSNTAVYKGCGWPLLGKNHENRVRSEDSDGLGNRSEIDPKRSSQIEVSKRVLTEHASTAISKISKQESNLKNKQAQDRKVGGDYTCKTQDSNVTPDQSSTNQILYSSKLCLVALGPLTNIATAVTLDPDLPSRFSKLVIYGGSLYGLNKNSVPSSNQNSSSESSSNSEFNFNFDPESARIVLEAFTPRIPVIIVPYDACKQNPISFERLPLLQASATVRSTSCARLSKFDNFRVFK